MALLSLPSLAPAVSLYVSPKGRDTWSGTLAAPNGARTDGPLASLEGARDAVRKLKTSGPLAAPGHGRGGGRGRYPLRRPLVLTPRDSGSAEAPVTYAAARGARPVFEGGRKIGGWTAGADGLWTARVADVAAGKWTFEQLWVNGRRAQRARTPNRFYSYITEGVVAGKDPDGKPADLSGRAFKGRPQDLAVLNGLSKEELNDVNVILYFSWESARMRVGAFDPVTTTRCYSPATLRGQLNLLGREPALSAREREGPHSTSRREWFLDRRRHPLLQAAGRRGT